MEFDSKLQSEELDELFKAILTLSSREECYRFFEDICTVSEIKAIAQRLEVALMLSKNMTYQEISSKTGASTATISRVNRSLMYGNGGYAQIIERMSQARDSKSASNPAES